MLQVKHKRTGDRGKQPGPVRKLIARVVCPESEQLCSSLGKAGPAALGAGEGTVVRCAATFGANKTEQKPKP